MLIGYPRVSNADGSQRLDLQRDALIAAGVASEAIYEDRASGKRDDRPGLETGLKALRSGDTLVVWKLDRLGRNLAHLVAAVSALADREVGLRVLAGQGAAIDTTTASGRLVFGSFAALAEFECELLRERTQAGLAAVRARGRTGGAEVRAHQGPGPARASHDEEPGHLGHRPRCGARHQTRHGLPIRRTGRGAASLMVRYSPMWRSALVFRVNDEGHDLVVGDVHGCFRTLERGLAALDFHPGHDRLFSVGDPVERGPHSEEAIEWIEQRFAGVTRGNHEQGALGWLKHRLSGSGDRPYGWLRAIAPETYPRHDRR